MAAASTPISLPRATLSGSVIPGAFHESSALTSHGSAASAFNLTQATSRSVAGGGVRTLIPPNALSSQTRAGQGLTDPFGSLPIFGSTPHPVTGPTTSSARINLAQVAGTSAPSSPANPPKPPPISIGTTPIQGIVQRVRGNLPPIGPVFPRPPVGVTATTPTSPGNPATTPPATTTGTGPTTADLLNSLFGAGASGVQPGGQSLITVPTQSTDSGASGSTATSGTGLVVLLFLALGAGVAWWWWKHKGPGKA